ncbi:hypothetical protein MMC27_002104 [Xylographa pallens]|nr:hypothetical protein [Xylographa pallens]
MPLKKLMKSGNAYLRSYGSPAKTPSPDTSLDAPVDSTPASVQAPPAIVSAPTVAPPSTTTLVQPPPTIMSPPTISPPTTHSTQPLPTTMSAPTISPPSTTDPPSPSLTTSTRASNLSTRAPTTPIRGPKPPTTPLTTPMRAPQRFDLTSTPLCNPLVRELHQNLDKQAGLARGYRSREAEIAKTRELIAEMTKPSKIADAEPQTVETWLALQERWIKWLERDMETVKAEFYALEVAELGLRERIEGKAGNRAGEVEVVEKALGELVVGGKGRGTRIVDGGTDGEKLNGGGEGVVGKSEGGGVKEGGVGSGS